MEEQHVTTAIKIVYLISFAIVSSYYFYWGENEVTVTDPVDESGWVPDGALASLIADA